MDKDTGEYYEFPEGLGRRYWALLLLIAIAVPIIALFVTGTLGIPS